MKFILSFLILFAVVSCKDVSSTKDTLVLYDFDTKVDDLTVAIGTLEVSKKELVLNQLEGIWYYNEKPYNGFSIKYYSNGTMEERMGFYNGKRQGTTQRWSPKGTLQSEKEYHQNKLVGTYKTWWENGQLAQESNYVNGVLQGTERQWHPNGQLAKVREIIDGAEQGMQKAWLKNGTLYVNYEAKNGRVFGLRRSNSCYKLEDETVVRTRK